MDIHFTVVIIPKSSLAKLCIRFRSMFLAKEGPPPELRTPAPCSSFDDGTTPVENGKEIDPTTAYSPSGRRLELMELAQETEKTVVRCYRFDMCNR